MQKSVHVDLGKRAYGVEIGAGILIPELEKLRGSELGGSGENDSGVRCSLNEVALVTDTSVAELSWYQQARELLKNQASRFVECVIASGEASKSLQVYAECCSKLAEAKISRKGTLVAIGGGVVGDLGGFLSASYLRGIPFVQVPTTLLSMVDSSVGGKTGVNLPEGKNLVGAFCQPVRVIADISTLKSLPAREVHAGMAEVIKYGVIRDAALFDKISAKAELDEEETLDVVERSVRIKVDIVEADETETSGQRALLNYGHTIGHAIENTMGYGVLLHGEAISLGMLAAAKISEQTVGFPPEHTAQLASCLEKHSLPVTHSGLAYDSLKDAMLRDKKATASGITWVVSSQIGESELCKDVPESLVQEAVAFVSA